MDLRKRVELALAHAYRLKEELGRGGMAVVYRAEDLKHDRSVAIKVLRPELSLALGADRFHREIQILARLTHPNVLPLHDSGDVDGLLYFVMPYVEGESLRDRLDRVGQLPIEEAATIAVEVADALVYAHAQGIVHRDIKPANILLEEGHAVVTDFGIARVIDSDTMEALSSSGLAVGTPVYMSPEQREAAPLDGRSDIFSLGCVLYEMLAGEAPFGGPNIQAIAAKQRSGTPVPLKVLRPSAGAAWDDVIKRAVAYLPGDRYQTAEAFARDLRALAPGATIPPRSTRSRRTATVAILWLTVILGLVLVWRMGLGKPPTGAAAVTRVLVLPFDGAGADPTPGRMAAHRRLAEALPALPGLQSLDGSDLIPAGTSWRAASIADLASVARYRGAAYYVAGSTGAGENGAFSAEIHDAADGHLITQVDPGTVAPGSDPVDALALRVLKALANGLSDLTLDQRRLLTATASADAYGHLVEAQRRFASRDRDGAAAELTQAIAADSGSYLAWHRLSVVEDIRRNHDAALRAIDQALARATGAPPHERALLEGQRHFVLTEAEGALQSFQQAVRDHPDHLDGLYGLGETLFHLGWILGISRADASNPFARLHRADSAFAPVATHLFDIALLQGHLDSARTWLRGMGPDNPNRPSREIALDLAGGGRRERRRAFERLRAADRYTHSELIGLLSFGRLDVPLADTVAGFLLDAGRTPEDRARGARYRIVLRASQDPAALPALLAEVPARPDIIPGDGWLMAAELALHGRPPRTSAVFADARRLVNRAPVDISHLLEEPAAHGLLGLVHEALLYGDSSEVRALLTAVAGAATTGGPSNPIPAMLRPALEARLALLARDTTRAIAALEAVMHRGLEDYFMFAPLASMAPERLLLAQLLLARGAAHGRVQRWLDTFAYSWAIGDRLYDDRVGALRAQLHP